MATELHDLSIAELSSLIAARKLSPLELVEALIRRVEQYDRQTHAFITRTFDLARQQAKQAEAEISAGRYRGRPWLRAWSRWRSAPIPADRSVGRRRSAASLGSCRRSAW